MTRVVIVGGGFSGIGCSLALLKERGFEVTIVESAERLGGLAFSFERDGKWIHTGYHQILETDGPLRQLIDELGLAKRVSWKRTQNKVWYKGKIYDLASPFDLARFPLSPLAKARMAALMARCYATRDWKSLENVAADAWLRRIAGTKVLDELFAPLFDVKFGLPPEKVSAAWVGSRLGAREASCRFGYIKGKEWTHEVCAAAAEKIVKRGGKILYNSRVRRIISRDGVVRGVELESGKVIAADVVVSTVSPIVLKRMIDLHDGLLDGIEYIDSVSTVMGVKSSAQKFYWLVCLKPRLFIGGLFNLTALNEDLGSGGETILNFFTNVDHGSSLGRKSDAGLLAIYKKEYKAVYGEDLEVAWMKVNRIPFVSAKYVKGYQNPGHRTAVKGLYLCGNYMSYPSVTSTGTAVRTGRDAAAAILADRGRSTA